MLGGHREDEQWTIVRLGERLFSFPSARVQEMLAVPEVRSIPGTPPAIRGVVNLRGRVLPMVDLRTRLGLSSNQVERDEMVTMIRARQEDHCRWVNELEACVAEEREFRLTTDPHACAFGKWYDRYHTDNLLMDGVLRKFDEPHRRIHATGLEIAELRTRGKTAEMRETIRRLRAGDLALMLRLFADLESAVVESHRETAVVLASGDSACAVSVDRVESVERLREGTLEKLPPMGTDAGEGMLLGIARRERVEGLVLILDAERLLSETCALARRAA